MRKGFEVNGDYRLMDSSELVYILTNSAVMVNKVQEKEVVYGEECSFEDVLAKMTPGKPDGILSASWPLLKMTLKLGLWLKVLVISVPRILMKEWLFLCPGTWMQTIFRMNFPAAISPTSRFPEQTFSLPVRLSCFLPICRWFI